LLLYATVMPVLSAARELSIEIPDEKRMVATNNNREKPKIFFIKPPEAYFCEQVVPFPRIFLKSLDAYQ
jgi:hypothetical protein